MAELVLALDQGTTSSRAILFDRRGEPQGVAQRELRQIFPRPGWVEHDPEEIWTSQLAVVQEVLAAKNLKPAELAALGITNQRETTVVWERATGRPIANAIVWQDRRTAGICDRLKQYGHEELVRRKTGLVIDAYFSGTKIRWLLDNVAGSQERATAGDLAFGTVDTWLIWKLTGGRVHVTDASNASRTLLFDIHAGDWDGELLEMLGIPRAMLPKVGSSSEVYGEVAAGLPAAGTPIAGVAGDQQAALFGQMCVRPGSFKNTYGTGCFLLLNTGDCAVPSQHGLVTTVAWRIGDRTEYALEGSIFIAGAVVQWLRDGLGLVRSAAEIEALAASVQDNGGVVLVPALAGLGAPHWDPHARGAVFGLTRGANAGHLARAALEGIAHQVADVVEAMESDAGLTRGELRVDGGAAANDLLMQFQADLLQMPVVRPTVLETTARGAAYLAGLAVGFWSNREEIAGQWQVDRCFEPTIDGVRAHGHREMWQRGVARAKGWDANSS